MKRLSITCFTLLLFLSACTGNREDKAVVEKGVKAQLVLKPFSDSLMADSFKLTLSGDKPGNMIIRFTITSHRGELIYSKDFKGADLVDGYKSTVALDKKKEQLAFILKEYDLFFEEDNFLEPAVTENETADRYTPDKEFYKELKNSNLNGFMYRFSKDTKVYIAWSEKEKKVKVYYQCC
jgi:hypothetical protein